MIVMCGQRREKERSLSQWWKVGIFCAVVLYSLAPGFAHSLVYEAEIYPWSGYWWPSREGGMWTGSDYMGTPAPLAKFDAASTRGESELIDWYRTNYHKPDGALWFGLCHAWALAAVSEPEPREAGIYAGIPFRVGDKKALLTLLHEKDICEIADGSDPLIFHMWIQRFLGRERKAFVADLEGGEEMWSFPVFRANISSLSLGLHTDFTTRIYYANDFVNPDFLGTDIRAKTYRYRLHRGDGAYTRGEWLGENIEDHPGLLRISVQRRGALDEYGVALVESIVASNESGPKVLATPGVYDFFMDKSKDIEISARPGQSVYLRFSFESRGKGYQFTLHDGPIVKEFSIADKLIEVWHVCETANPVVRVESVAEAKNVAFSLRYDAPQEHVLLAPYLQNRDVWAGIAGLENSGQKVAVTLRAANGDPLSFQELVPSGKKYIGLAENLRSRSLLRGRPHQIELTSDRPLKAIGLTGGINGLAAFIPKGSRGAQGVCAFLPGHGQGLLYARSFAERKVKGRMECFREGLSVVSLDISLAPYEVKYFTIGVPPLAVGRIDYVNFYFDEGEVACGTSFVSRRGSINFSATADYAKEFFLSHLTNVYPWNTSLHIINPSSSPSHVVFVDLNGNEIYSSHIGGKSVLNVETDAFVKSGSMIKVIATEPVSGKVVYSAPYEAASFPMQKKEDAAIRLIVPHVSEGIGPWWTGLILANPGLVGCNAQISYYDMHGNVLEKKDIYIPSFGFNAFPVTRNADIAYAVVDGTSELLGSVLYGTDDLRSLEGALLKSESW